MPGLAVLLRWICVWAVALSAGSALAQAETVSAPKVGVFYFGGWKDGALGLAYPKPWEPIKKFPEREPLLGWYDEGRVEVMDQHLNWMSSHGLDFVVFTWFWGGQQEVLAHAVDAYMQSRVSDKIPYALMWANHGRGPLTRADFQGAIRNLLNRHFQRPDYLRIQGRPVFFIMVPENLEAKAQAFGTDTTELFREAQAMARQAGVDALFLAAGAGGGPGLVPSAAKRWGYEAFFTYNYHAGIGGRTNGEQRFSRSFAELDAGYREHWNWFVTAGELPYIVPMTAGWDKRPWGGSQDPLHDLSMPKAGEFKAHIQAARDLMIKHPKRTLGMGIICCWNEFGEGSIIEPTKARGTKELETVRSVFEQ